MKGSLRGTALDEVLKPLYRPSLIQPFSDVYINESSGVSTVQPLTLTSSKMTRGGMMLPNALTRRAKLHYHSLRQNFSYKMYHPYLDGNYSRPVFRQSQ
jgi:hypothetical protein